MGRTSDTDLVSKIKALAGRARGVTRTDLHSAVCPELRPRALELLEQLHAAGELHRQRAGKRGWRYFATAEAAAQYVAAQVDLLPSVKGDPAPPKRRGRPKKTPVLHDITHVALDEASRRHRGGRMHATVLPGSRIPGRHRLDSDAPVDVSRAKVTVWPSVTHDPRVQCAPGERVWGCGFSALGPGRYVDEPVSCAAKAASR